MSTLVAALEEAKADVARMQHTLEVHRRQCIVSEKLLAETIARANALQDAVDKVRVQEQDSRRAEELATQLDTMTRERNHYVRMIEEMREQKQKAKAADDDDLPPLVDA
jgi:septal ring factor EnvC (AmiA/AmiB activator)